MYRFKICHISTSGLLDLMTLNMCHMLRSARSRLWDNFQQIWTRSTHIVPDCYCKCWRYLTLWIGFSLFDLERQWRYQAWGNGARAPTPWNLRMHANLSSAVLNGTLCSGLTSSCWPFRRSCPEPSLGVRKVNRIIWHFEVRSIFTALHGCMQTRSSDENSVCLSVRPSVCVKRVNCD